MIKLKLTPGEFAELYTFIKGLTSDQITLPLAHQPVRMLVLIEYLARWPNHRVVPWLIRPRHKEYSLSLKPVVAKTLHEEMEGTLLTGLQQLVLNKLDHAIVNYKSPDAIPHVTGELVR
jgi:hypothetical protein